MIHLPSPEQKLNHPLFDKAGVELWIKRDDLIHPEISGNKWRKLAPILHLVQERGVRHVVSYGGAWSNHLLALASACSFMGLQATGIVRGEEIDNPVLRRCASLGMRLEFISREAFRNLRNNDNALIWEENCCIIPEGANCSEGRAGMSTLWAELKQDYTYLLDSVGSGTSVRGLLASAPEQTSVLAVMAVNDWSLANHLKEQGAQVFDSYTCGGFAKMNAQLLASCLDFEKQTGVKLDPIYTSKQWLAARGLLEQGFFKRGDKVLFVHSGGLAGWQSFKTEFQ